MSISVPCTTCGKKYRVSERHAGRRFTCKECGELLVVAAAAIDEKQHIARVRSSQRTAKPASRQGARAEIASPPRLRLTRTIVVGGAFVLMGILTAAIVLILVGRDPARDQQRAHIQQGGPHAEVEPKDVAWPDLLPPQTGRVDVVTFDMRERRYRTERQAELVVHVIQNDVYEIDGGTDLVELTGIRIDLKSETIETPAANCTEMHVVRPNPDAIVNVDGRLWTHEEFNLLVNAKVVKFMLGKVVDEPQRGILEYTVKTPSSIRRTTVLWPLTRVP